MKILPKDNTAKAVKSAIQKVACSCVVASVGIGVGFGEPSTQDVKKQIEALKKENELLELERKNQMLKGENKDLQTQINEAKKQNQALKNANERERERVASQVKA